VCGTSRAERVIGRVILHSHFQFAVRSNLVLKISVLRRAPT
jgi:hypothetical protein